MQITVILPHDDHRKSAGVRIRYERIREQLARLGHSLDFALIHELHTITPPKGDVFVFCKCQDIRSVLLAEALRAHGGRVGIDVFDDYFSQTDDMRLTHVRGWMKDILPRLDFLLCATDAMQARLERMAPGLPIHRMNDPLDRLDLESIGASLTARLERLRLTGHVEVGWFGTGDNPYFPVGLDDLCNHGEVLAGFRRRGLRASLRVLTNTRAMTPARLARLARLPVPVQIDEWTLEREERLLAECFAAFLPVGTQLFSTVKSLNRAVTALTRGVQVLTAGAPIYAALEPFCYRGTDELVDDVLRGAPRLRARVLPSLSAAFARIAHPAHEAARLTESLTAVAPPPAKVCAKAEPVIVLHGAGSSKSQHKFIQRSKMFSVAGPFQNAPLNFDLKFVKDGPEQVVATISARMTKLLHPDRRAKLRPWPSNSQIVYSALSLGPVPGLCLSMQHIAERLATYDLGMRTAAATLASLFPGARIVVSETAAPFTLRPGPAIAEAVHA